jgi:predicted acyltransferase
MSQELKKVPQGRVVSIDALRGFDMFWIIGGEGVFKALIALLAIPWLQPLAAQLGHSKWNGFTFYDLIFPLFLFIMGAAMPFAISRRVQRGDDRGEIYRHIVQRFLTLLFLGFIYNQLLDFDFAHFRYTGVLHRIAVCYLIGALIVMNTKIKTQAIIAGAILLVYWAIMKLVPVPGFGAGVITPEGNLAGYIDRLLLPGSFCCYQFGDNEGILSTIPAVSTTLMGVLSGHWLRADRSGWEKTKYLLGVGIICLVVSDIWNLVFPINKLIWSSSYVLHAGGYSLLLLGVFYWIIDVKGYKSWTLFFVVIGLNPITIYVLQSQFDFGIITHIFIRGFVGSLGDFRPLVEHTGYLLFSWLFLYFLYRKKIFLKA